MSAATHSASLQSLMAEGKLRLRNCEIRAAIESYKKAVVMSREAHQLPEYFESQSQLIRLFAEREDYSAIKTVIEEVAHTVLTTDSARLTARATYTMGIAATYERRSQDALELFTASLKTAVENGNRSDIAFALFGRAHALTEGGKFDEALKAIDKLDEVLEATDLEDLKITCLMIRASILNDLGDHDSALAIYWKSYDSLRLRDHLYLHISLLYAMAKTHKLKGQRDLAIGYAVFAKKLIDPDDLVYKAKFVDKLLAEIGHGVEEQFDFAVDMEGGSFDARAKRTIDFKNQYVLLDLLRTFLAKPGVEVSKEEIVRAVWKEEYDPALHDNKVYVTIRRLRRLIDSSKDGDEYIVRSKGGYYMRPNTRVLIKDQDVRKQG